VNPAVRSASNEAMARRAPRRLISLVTGACLAAGTAAANGPASAGGEASDCAVTAVAAIQKRYEAVRDLRSRFEQTTRAVALGGPGATTVSRGTASFAKPGRMRWSYEEPEPSLVVSDGTTLWIYDPANREVQRLAVDRGFLSGAAIQFLLGEGDILREFAVTARSCEEDLVELELVPRQETTYEKLILRADPRRGDLRETTVVDLLGNATTVAFREVETNRDLAPELFRFEPPPGVRVVDLGGPP
jgi:outer membrane lipoprotein carrier protein